MSRLLQYRERYNITQRELSEKSGISVRTIQRIEAGAVPKGYTLRALLKTLDVTEEELFPKEKNKEINSEETLKWINLSSLLFIIPFANILVPFFLMKMKDEVNEKTKQIISLQIFWTLCSMIVIGISPFLVKWLGTSRQMTLQLIIISALINLFIIFRNAVEIERNKRLYIKLNFSFL